MRRPIQGCGGELTNGLRIVYRWDESETLRHQRIAHGLAHCLLMYEKWDHSETDALLLTVDFLPSLPRAWAPLPY